MNLKKISLEDDKLVLAWDDGSVGKIKLTALRRNCPCAICEKEREEHSEFYVPLFSDDQLTLTDISIVGNYAVSINWKDGHNSGIFEYSQLIEMCREDTN